MKKFCVFGAGAIGGHLAGRLYKAGFDVSVVARGPHLEAMKKNGLKVKLPDETIEAKVRVAGNASELGPQDAVIVAVKAPAIPGTAKDVATLLGPDTPVVYVLNGIPWWYHYGEKGANKDKRLPLLDADDAAWNAIGPQRVIGGIAWSSCTVTEPGVVFVERNINRFVLGEPDGSISPRVQEIARALEAGGVTAPVTARIRDNIWEKLVLNAATGPMSILVQAALRDLFAETAAVDISRAMIAEGQAMARAMGCTTEPDKPFDFDAFLKQVGASKHKPSILQDLELGRPMEIDAIYEVPLQMARAAGVPAPVSEMMVGLAKVRARAAGIY